MATENLEINIGANTQDLQTGLNQATQSVQSFGNAVKTNLKPTADATNALGNLSRVAQDAPYGFMGIANNLNPLLESFQRLQTQAGSSGAALKAMVAGLSGPAGIGVALGVASSLVVAFSDEIDAFFTKLDEGSDASIRYKEALKGIGSGFTTALEKVSDVKIAFEEYHKGILTGEQALAIYNEQLGKNLGVKDNINDAEATFIAKSGAYVEAQFQRSLADAASKKAAEELLKAKLLQETGGEKTGSLVKGIALVAAPYLPKPLTDQLFGLYDKKKFESDLTDANNLYEAFNKIKQRALENADKIDADAAITTSQTEIKRQADEEKRRNAALKNINKSSSSVTQEKEKVDISDLETLKKKQQLYREDAYAFKQYADLITKEEERIALEKARINKASANEIANIKEQAAIGLEQNAINLGKSLDKIFDAADKEYVKNEKEKNKKLLEDEEKAAKERLKIEAEKQKKLEELQKQQEKFAESLSIGITQGLMTMYDAMQQGEPPLKALGDYVANLAKQFAAAIIQATIFKGIMSLLNLATGGGGGFFGGILGGVGKLLGMAEGGIVSRPTLAMVGEGGQSEAVMPLNKLGNMMNSTFNAGAMSGTGAGNGQFVLKGNDLVLALQRSNYSLNLRRGNGI